MMECVQKLASTTFVQTVTAAPLALIAPLLLLAGGFLRTTTRPMLNLPLLIRASA